MYLLKRKRKSKKYSSAKHGFIGELFSLPYLCPEFWLLPLWFAFFVFLQTNNKIRELCFILFRFQPMCYNNCSGAKNKKNCCVFGLSLFHV